MDFGPKLGDLLASVAPEHGVGADLAPIVVVGGGKSAQEYVLAFQSLSDSDGYTVHGSICAYLANEGRKVTMVCHNLDAFTAGPKPLPDFIRKSRCATMGLPHDTPLTLLLRFLSLFSPHTHLRTVLEYVEITSASLKFELIYIIRRFLHTTWLGKRIVDFMWHGLAESSVRLIPHRTATRR